MPYVRTTAAGLLTAVTLIVSTVSLTGSQQDTSSTMLVLDASGSMWAQVGGRTKIAIARDAVDTMVSTWRGGDLGLMAYGHNRKGDCNDIEVLHPIGRADAAAMRRTVGGLNPRGMTPISASVRQAANLLRLSERKATVILISDGEETCGADPCAVGKELEAIGVDFTAHVVGFDIARGSRARQQLECLAASTGGRYLDARDARELSEALADVAAASSGRLTGAQEWLPGYSLGWVAGTVVDGVEDNHATRSVAFSVEQTARDCQTLCNGEAGCAGWHYEPTGSYFIDHPRCFLKGYTAPLRLEKQDDNWIAGVKPGARIVMEQP